MLYELLAQVHFPSGVQFVERIILQTVYEQDAFSRTLHFRTQLFVHFVEFIKGEYRLLNGISLQLRVVFDILHLHFAQHHLGGIIDIWLLVGLGNEWHRPGSSRVGLNDIHLVVLDGKLDVDQSNGIQGKGDLFGVVLNLFHHQVSQIERRQSGVGISGVDPAGLDVFHDPDDLHIRSVADGISFSFYCPVQVVVQQEFVVRDLPQKVHHMLFEFFFVNNDLHSLPSQYVRRSYKDGEIKFIGQGQGLIGSFSHSEVGVGNIICLQKGGETPPIFSQVQGRK